MIPASGIQYEYTQTISAVRPYSETDTSPSKNTVFSFSYLKVKSAIYYWYLS